MITKQMVIEKISQYLHHHISLEELVDWAESGMLNEPFDERYYNEIRAAVARLGVADVRTFGLTWEDCEQLFDVLGYSAHVEIVMQ
jgi:cobyrinic acid a,c-diamide synthase